MFLLRALQCLGVLAWLSGCVLRGQGGVCVKNKTCYSPRSVPAFCLFSLPDIDGWHCTQVGHAVGTPGSLDLCRWECPLEGRGVHLRSVPQHLIWAR